MFVLLILKLWATGASMVAGQSTRGPGQSEAAARTESIPEQVELSAPPAVEHGEVHASPATPALTLVANDDTELVANRAPDDTGPPVRAMPSRPSRTRRMKPPRRASRACCPAIALRI